MKKLLTITILLITIMVASCTPAECTIPQPDSYNYEEGIDTLDNLEESLDEPIEEPEEEPHEEPSYIGFSVTTYREFNVIPGNHGYFAVAFIEYMQDNLPFRIAFSDRELEAAYWISNTLLDMGFDESQIEMQSFRVDAPTSSWWRDPSYAIEWYIEAGFYDDLELLEYSQNVILTIPGRSDGTIIIGAHYDSVDNPGISDNAAGVALLLENAYRMKHQDHYYTLKYIFYGAEEVGLVGAFYFADSLSPEDIENIVLVVNADVIIEGPNFMYGVGYIEELPEWPMGMLWGGEEVEISQNQLTESIDALAQELASQDIHLIAEPRSVVFPTDHLAFLGFGVPVLNFYGTYEPIYPELIHRNVLHTPNDCLDFFFDNFPGRIEDGMNTFGRFLELVIMSL